MKCKFVLYITFALTLSACNNGNQKELLSEIDEMETTLDSLNVVANDTTRYGTKNIVTSVRETILKVKKHYTTDTIDYELANQMNSYKEIRKGLSKNTSNLTKVKLTIPEVQAKLSDLKHDVENGINDRDKYKEFVNYEKTKIFEISEVLSYYLETSKMFYDRYDSLHPIIKNLGDSLELHAND